MSKKQVSKQPLEQDQQVLQVKKQSGEGRRDRHTVSSKREKARIANAQGPSTTDALARELLSEESPDMRVTTTDEKRPPEYNSCGS